MAVGIVTTLSFIVFFTPGQLSILCIINWQLSANLNKYFLKLEYFLKLRLCSEMHLKSFVRVLRVGCVGLYQLTHLRT